MPALGLMRCGRGLSPRVRGNRQRSRRQDARRGSIPASAGEPTRSTPEQDDERVYPRECGGTRGVGRSGVRFGGLSPRVRGNPSSPSTRARASRSIPASAGEPLGVAVLKCQRRVYPRECGGTFTARFTGIAEAGLSPRVRGNQGGGERAAAYGGSIPASAGEPQCLYGHTAITGVYPRECGGTCCRRTRPSQSTGLSPRVRGNRHAVAQQSDPMGSIPASAGEPLQGGASQRQHQVYPRECGGTWRRSRCQPAYWGLSPRVRGNLGGMVSRRPISGSIPASAGEPPAVSSKATPRRVYPRECGGTCMGSPKMAALVGLSPRVRGNRRCRTRRGGFGGSIPASAGEPTGHAVLLGVEEVYPRECGGTLASASRGTRNTGLSPRVRGNRAPGRLRELDAGSIPASAGEPSPATALAVWQRVYPRECGGTRERRLGGDLERGLSPRVRGNLLRPAYRPTLARSIPASAGEPFATGEVNSKPGVYPRECGGTDGATLMIAIFSGLSPRVRGNRILLPRLPRRPGSIPASAGEPQRWQRRVR